MGLSVGIVGLPNVGKSTLFNALTKAQNAESANYPFCTIEPNKAIVPVPDNRLNSIAGLVNPQKITHATVDFVDIAGLVKGASKGEGLGNQFLSNIRECEAILHVVRCFENNDIVHVNGNIDPLSDIETIETELLLADIQALERKAEKLQKAAKADKNAAVLLKEVGQIISFLYNGKKAAHYPEADKPEVKQIFNELRLLTLKPVIYCGNVDEAGLAEDNEYVNIVKHYADSNLSEFVKISARTEEELVALSDDERAEFLNSYGVSESGLEKIINTAFRTLGLISYFTAGPKEVRAWTIEKGWKAPQAAGVIHTDFEKGFIRAEVISFADYLKHRSETACKSAGVMRVEGKDYIVKDSDIIHFLFNV